MISTSGGGDYQHEAEGIVGIERNGLSVFILHGLKKSNLIVPRRPALVYNLMSSIVLRAAHMIERIPGQRKDGAVRCSPYQYLSQMKSNFVFKWNC
jgi:hypothetical protein